VDLTEEHVLLIKASRTMKFETIYNELLENKFFQMSKLKNERGWKYEYDYICSYTINNYNTCDYTVYVEPIKKVKDRAKHKRRRS